jgi:hypothetical protein
MNEIDALTPVWAKPSLGAKYCPSSADWNVRYVIGRREKDGTTRFVKELVPVGPEVLDHLRLVGDDYRYRFGGVCIQGGCVYWANGCDLGTSVTKVAIEKKLKPRDPCVFKALCRWFAENGADACGGCAFVSRKIVSKIDEQER